MSTNTLHTPTRTDRRVSTPPTRYDPASGKAVVVGTSPKASNTTKPRKASKQELAARERAAQATRAAQEQDARIALDAEFNAFYLQQLREKYAK